MYSYVIPLSHSTDKAYCDNWKHEVRLSDSGQFLDYTGLCFEVQRQELKAIMLRSPEFDAKYNASQFARSFMQALRFTWQLSEAIIDICPQHSLVKTLESTSAVCLESCLFTGKMMPAF